MQFSFTKEQTMMQSSLREFTKKELSEASTEIDAMGKFSTEIKKKMSEMDLFGVLIPFNHGGMGMSPIEFAIIVEEISTVNASIGASVATTIHAASAILAFGSDEQKEKYLPAIAKGKSMASFACTEPAGGTNWPITAKTSATLDKDHYIINGSKCFISNAGIADIYIIMARTAPNSMDFSTFIIEKDTAGFSIGKMEDKFGLRGCPTGELFLDNCRIPKSNLLGKECEGLDIFRAAGGLHCVGAASIYVGLSQAALDACIQYSKEKEYIPSETLSYLESIQGTISEMTAQVEATRLLNLKAATLLQESNYTSFLSMQYGSRVALKVTGDAVALHGGYGCVKDNLVNRLFRDAKTLSLQVTYDSMKSIIGKLILEVPPQN